MKGKRHKTVCLERLAIVFVGIFHHVFAYVIYIYLYHLIETPLIATFAFIAQFFHG